MSTDEAAALARPLGIKRVEVDDIVERIADAFKASGWTLDELLDKSGLAEPTNTAAKAS